MEATSTILQELLGVPYLFNVLAVMLPAFPFVLLSLARMTPELTKYFKIRSFIIGCLLNFTLVCHILFVKDNNEHTDSLYVAIVGMVMGAISTFLWLLHAVLVRWSRWARFGMVVVMGALIGASSIVLHALQQELQLAIDKGWGLALGALAVIIALVLNGYPLIGASLSDTSVQPDVPVDVYGLFMTLLNTADTCYFVVYAYYLGAFSLLSIVSLITAIFGVFQLVVFLRSLVTAIVSAANSGYCFLVACLAALIIYVIWDARRG